MMAWLSLHACVHRTGPFGCAPNVTCPYTQTHQLCACKACETVIMRACHVLHVLHYYMHTCGVLPRALCKQLHAPIAPALRTCVQTS